MQPSLADLEGTLTIHEAKIGPGPLADQYISLAQQVKALMEKKPLDALGGLAGGLGGAGGLLGGLTGGGTADQQLVGILRAASRTGSRAARRRGQRRSNDRRAREDQKNRHSAGRRRTLGARYPQGIRRGVQAAARDAEEGTHGER